MSARWWNWEEIIASRRNLLQQEVPRRDIGVGEGTQPYKFSNILVELILTLMQYVSWELDIISCALDSIHSICFSSLWAYQWRINLLVNILWSRWSSLYMPTYLQFDERVSLPLNMMEIFCLSETSIRWFWRFWTGKLAPCSLHPAPYSVLTSVSFCWRDSCRTMRLKAYLYLVLSSRVSGCIYRYNPKYNSTVLCTLKQRNPVAFIWFWS